MSNTILIEQPAGLGDIFFCQKIAETFIHNNYKVIWPVKSSISWVGDYLSNSSMVSYPTQEAYVRTGEEIVITLDGAQNTTGGLIMPSKYEILGLDWNDWSDYFHFNRNSKKEDELFYEVLGLTDQSDYTFVNRHFATPPDSLLYDVETFSGERVVSLEFIPYFTLFDWCKVIERASRISIIDTSLNYIIEKLQLSTDDLTCYCRWGEKTYHEINILFKQPWRYLWKQ